MQAYRKLTALDIATRHGYQQLVPQFQRIRDSIPASPE